jgi:hypothetical protein
VADEAEKLGELQEWEIVVKATVVSQPQAVPRALI